MLSTKEKAPILLKEYSSTSCRFLREQGYDPKNVEAPDLRPLVTENFEVVKFSYNGISSAQLLFMTATFPPYTDKPYYMSMAVVDRDNNIIHRMEGLTKLPSWATQKVGLYWAPTAIQLTNHGVLAYGNCPIKENEKNHALYVAKAIDNDPMKGFIPIGDEPLIHHPNWIIIDPCPFKLSEHGTYLVARVDIPGENFSHKFKANMIALFRLTTDGTRLDKTFHMRPLIASVRKDFRKEFLEKFGQFTFPIEDLDEHNKNVREAPQLRYDPYIKKLKLTYSEGNAFDRYSVKEVDVYVTNCPFTNKLSFYVPDLSRPIDIITSQYFYGTGHSLTTHNGNGKIHIYLNVIDPKSNHNQSHRDHAIRRGVILSDRNDGTINKKDSLLD